MRAKNKCKPLNKAAIKGKKESDNWFEILVNKEILHLRDKWKNTFTPWLAFEEILSRYLKP